MGVINTESGNLLYDDVKKAERFNSFLSSVFTHGIIPSVISKAKPKQFY